MHYICTVQCTVCVLPITNLLNSFKVFMPWNNSNFLASFFIVKHFLCKKINIFPVIRLWFWHICQNWDFYLWISPLMVGTYFQNIIFLSDYYSKGKKRKTELGTSFITSPSKSLTFSCICPYEKISLIGFHLQGTPWTFLA